MNVGSGCIAEIVGETAETFDGNVSAASLITARLTGQDLQITISRAERWIIHHPIRLFYESGSVKNEYVTLRAGYRVYKQTRDKPNTRYEQITTQRIGTLPIITKSRRR